MSNWLRFIKKNKRMLNFGFQFNFFSAFGQTFLVSLYVPYWIKIVDISNAGFGMIYSALTITSAFLLSFFGGYIDKMPLKRYGLIVVIALMISAAALSQINSLIFLVLVLLLVRWLGQGMMTHTSAAGMGKTYGTDRGKALSITALGMPASQILLPGIITYLIVAYDWRTSLLILVAFASIILIPSVQAINKVGLQQDLNVKSPLELAKEGLRHLKRPVFRLMAFNFFLIPFVCTAIFLYQYTLGEAAGYSKEWVTFSFTFFAVFNAAGMLLSGELTDRFSGKFLFPLYLIPAFMGLAAFSLTDAQWMFPFFYALLGISSGIGTTVSTAVQAEVYGQKVLGKMRSYFTTLLVLSTALSPPFMGFFLDNDRPAQTAVIILTALTGLIIIMSFRLPKLIAENPPKTETEPGEE
jgi:MFS family permease